VLSSTDAGVRSWVAAVVGPASIGASGNVAVFGANGKVIADGGTLGDAAFDNVGVTTGTVAAGDDSRIVNAVPNTRTVNGLPLSADINISSSSGGIASTYLFCEDVIFAGTTPVWHELEKQSDGGAAGSHTATTTSYTELDRYVTSALNTTIIPGGIWAFDLFCKCSTQSGQIEALIYRVDTAGAIVGSVLGTAESAVFTNTTTAPIRAEIYIAEQTGWAATDRIGVVLKAKKVGAPAATITFYHDRSSGWVSVMTTPITLLHNQLAGLNQGDYNHLTAAQHTIATQAASASVAGYVTTGTQTFLGQKHSRLLLLPLPVTRLHRHLTIPLTKLHLVMITVL
jgi:hypothetical protein